MAYSSGMLNKRITIACRAEDNSNQFGKQGQARYTILGQFWAAEDFNRGVKSLREGAYDAYDTVMFRLRYTPCIDRWCLIWYNGRFYQIQSLNDDAQANQIQITAVEMPNQNVTIVEPNQA